VFEKKKNTKIQEL